MADYNDILRERQKAIRRQIDSREMSIKAIYMDGGWENDSTVLSYFPADKDAKPAVMSVAALYRFIKTEAIPIDLLSLLLPEGHAIVRVPEGVNHDEIAPAMQDYLAAKDAAHHPESEAGRDVGPTEDNVLRGKFARVRAA